MEKSKYPQALGEEATKKLGGRSEDLEREVTDRPERGKEW